MKVAYILPIGWGGIPHYTAELANAVSKYCDVVIFKVEDSNDILFNSKVDIVHISGKSYFSRKNLFKSTLLNLPTLFKCKNSGISKLGIDLVHFPEVYPQSVLMSFADNIAGNYPIVVTLHSTFKSITHAFRSTSVLENFYYGIISCTVDLMKFLINSDMYIVHSIKNKKLLISRGIPSSKIVVIPHGAYSFFRKNYRENFKDMGSKFNDFNILFFGYIKRNKGVDYLLRAIPIISKKVENFKVVVAGDGNIDNRYLENKDIKSKLILYNKFIPNKKVFELFYRADVVVLPYILHLGHSGVLTVAFSFGKPVVVTNVGNLPELVKNGREGFVVPPKDPKALADAIIKILEDDKLRKKMSRNALKKAEELSWDRIAKMHIKVYEEIIKGENS